MIDRRLDEPQINYLNGKGIKVRGKGFGGKLESPNTVGKVMTVEYTPQHFVLIDDKKWASPRNAKRHSNRLAKDPHETAEYDTKYYGEGIHSADDIRSITRDGWQEGVDMVRDLSAEVADLVPQPVAPRRRAKRGDFGEEIDMARVYSGQIDTAWRYMGRDRLFGPRVISMDVDVCYNAGVNAKDLFWAGATAVVLVDLLEAAGYRVELYSTAASKNYTDNATLSRILAKRADDPLDLANIAGLVCHPATFRWYHLNATTCDEHSTVPGGYGQACDAETFMEQLVAEGMIEGSDFVVKGVLSREACLETIREVIAKVEESQEAGEGVF